MDRRQVSVGDVKHFAANCLFISPSNVSTARSSFGADNTADSSLRSKNTIAAASPHGPKPASLSISSDSMNLPPERAFRIFQRAHRAHEQEGRDPTVGIKARRAEAFDGEKSKHDRVHRHTDEPQRRRPLPLAVDANAKRVNEGGEAHDLPEYQRLAVVQIGPRERLHVKASRPDVDAEAAREHRRNDFVSLALWV